jgi:hypothetical protein
MSGRPISNARGLGTELILRMTVKLLSMEEKLTPLERYARRVKARRGLGHRIGRRWQVWPVEEDGPLSVEEDEGADAIGR